MIYENRYKGRRAVITGGASGIGFGVASRLVAEGASVCLWDVNPDSIAKATAELGDKAMGVQVNVADWDTVERAASETVAKLGGIDVLVACAGITGPNTTLWDYPVDSWRQVMDINVNGIFHCNRAVVPHMMSGGYGRIVNIASVAGKEGNPNASAYSTSKAAVIGLTKSLGKELAKTNITVNAVTPAAVKTAIFDQMTQQHIDFMLSKIPMGRFGLVEEITSLVCWIASDECSFTTGSVFDASGGRATY
ncbi:3-oxoacyl-ACP reductase [Skermanella stibiiresistens SB22]|uniref:3-oxoacyl-ACP reductase n=1 Tax=Skermanella stibiiresistens SB22 TaxID=1385369 RepID=W9H1V2_9PROT|nr:SDR family NAD(P)-dependent oxidoreductase [Skermanella stibiiresistens]EWY37733.1 3-oxoacyl-ACP reductase [Skermanella stibiiresistens SB22]